MGYSFNRKRNILKEKNIGVGPTLKWKGLGRVLRMTSHSGKKEEGIFFSFQTTKPRRKKSEAKNLKKSKEKERAKNQVVTVY